MNETSPDNVVRFHQDDDALVGTRWWNEAFAQSIVIGRRHLHYLVAGGVVAVIFGKLTCSDDADEDTDIDVSMDALELQRRSGWNVGISQSTLAVASPALTDVEGGNEWQSRIRTLAQALAPQSPHLQPHYVPTLFQVLAEPGSESLAASLRPMYRSSMREAHEAAQSLAALITDVDTPRDMAVILDLPGPESVAAAAALADAMVPVFTFDNWPHPRGVVPAEQTLAATLFYLPRFLKAASARPEDAPAVFVLDAARLSPYRDEADRFDNRYIAKLPTAAGWKTMGVKQLLYVRPGGASATELDDLNEDFVAYRNEGIDIKMVSLGDFLAPVAAQATTGGRHYWGGSPQTHVLFWPSYGWYRPARSTWAPGVQPQLSSTAKAALPRASLAYQPAARATMFSGRTVGGLPGVGKHKPSGFGRITVRSNPRTGAISSYSSGRSGSFGRSRSSWSG